MTKVNWLEATGQMWKLYVAILSCVLALIAFPFAVVALISGQGPMMPYLVTGTVLSLATVLWLMWSLRCLSCHRSLVWNMIRTRSHTTWLVDLVHLEACPYCSHALRPLRQGRKR